ncbi:RNA-binding protein 41 isoform 13 [Homo sapiens]|uniref:RNA-binding protein 41 isoform 13 n=2 Tax=Homo sapiens TaxID=9606 RepID=UPI000511C979|nr:RNA-binding protein 41 isoform 13 [Homo sapiens]XP_009437742.1 RNA-binding protein 41 isoform X16 [Pan troglodytes]
MPSRHGPRELAGCCGFVVSPGPSWAKGFEADKFPAPEMVNSCVKSDEHVLEELETEGERQLKSLLQHQLDTSVSIEECMSKKESFAPGTMYKPFGKEAAGTMTLSQFQTLHEKDQETASLRELGLNETEILIWKSHVSGEKKTKLRATPEAIQNRLQDIEERISERQRILCLPQRFAKSKQLTRREMEIEKSLFQGADRHSFLKALYYQAYHKKTSADKYMTSMKRKIKLGTKGKYLEVGLLGHMVLYLKNLSPRVTERDLVSLFARFQEKKGPPIQFRMMTGRMRGQAFITFPNKEIAWQALHLVNGYKLHGKILVIEFGKNKKQRSNLQATSLISCATGSTTEISGS